MPFRDKEWENLQRDHALFPAYTDYILGPDTRTHIAQEPGLDLKTSPPVPNAPVHDKNSMPSSCWSHNSILDMAHPASPIALALPSQASASMRLTINHSQQQTSIENGEISSSISAPRHLYPDPPRPTSAVHVGGHPATSAPLLPVFHQSSSQELSSDTLRETPALLGWQHEMLDNLPQVPFVRPNDLISDPYYAFIPEHDRQTLNHTINQLWQTSQSHPSKKVREESATRIQWTSQDLRQQRKKWEATIGQPEGRMPPAQGLFSAQEERPEYVGEPPRAHTGASSLHGPPAQPMQYPQGTQAFASGVQSAKDPSSLPATTRMYIHAQIPQLWRYLNILRTNVVPGQGMRVVKEKQQAQQWLLALENSLLPDGKLYFHHIVTRMWEAFRAGRDPLQVVETYT